MERILIFEDDLLSQDLMKKIFAKEYEVDICESGEEYYHKYSCTKYDIIVMDIALKGKKQGLELIKEIRSSSIQKNIPIICLTAHVQAGTREKALEAGADLFFTKPVHNTLLKEAVVSFLKHHDELI